MENILNVGIFYKVLSVPRNTAMDPNNVMWMTYLLVSDNNRKVVKSTMPLNLVFSLQGMINSVKFAFSISDVTTRLAERFSDVKQDKYNW